MQMEQLEALAKSTADDLEKKIGEGAQVIVMLLDAQTGSNYAAWRGSPSGVVYTLDLLDHQIKKSYFERKSDAC